MQRKSVSFTGDMNYEENQSRNAAPASSLSDLVGWCRFCQVKLPYWDPEDRKQWEGGGSQIAHRNLLVSMPNLSTAFGVWLAWSVIVPQIQLMHDKDPSVYSFKDWGSPTGGEYKVLLYTLPAVAGLSGGTLRVANAFLTQIVGGRNVVAHSSIMLLIAMILTAVTLKNKDAPFTALLVAAWLSGTGGGAFASSMSNMSFLYPKSQQGYCLGMNGGLGNLGVSISQLLVPVFMSTSFGRLPLSDNVTGWPDHAGWFWWPSCLVCSIMAFIWMNNHPEHGNHPNHWSDGWGNIIYYYWFECVGLLSALLSIIVLLQTRDTPLFKSTYGGEILNKFLLVLISLIIEHLALVFFSPKASKPSLREQAEIFKDKHTWVMTVLYTMCFGSFIGFSGAFPKLIQDLFGYVVSEGCYYTVQQQQQEEAMNMATTTLLTNSSITERMIARTLFVQYGTEHDCVADGGVWGQETVTNPNAPNVFKYAWCGACIGSLIRPFGGIIGDKYGGAKVTQILIMWCTLATVALGVLVQVTQGMTHPENSFALFVFLFLNVFLCVGAMNGTTFRTIGVLFDYQQAGPVLGWSSAVASYGAFIIPSLFAVSISAGRPETTFYILSVFYFLCGILNYWYYGTPGTDKPGV